jgi:hypothetical protein
MRILFLFLADVALLATLVLLTGWLLPATREGRAETTIAAPPDQVLAVIADVESQPEWRDVGTVTRTQTGWFEVTARGERIDFVSEEMSVQGIRLRFTSDAGYSGEWQARLEPVVERATVPSPVGRIMARLLFDPAEFATTYLDALKTRVEGR